MSSKQQRYRNFSSDSMGRERAPSDDGYYQGMLKAIDGRKGTSMVTDNKNFISIFDTVSVAPVGKNKLVFHGDFPCRNSFKEVGRCISVVWHVLL